MTFLVLVIYRYVPAGALPAKDVVLFDGGHMVAMLQSEAFLKALVEKVLPVAARARISL